MTRFDLLCLTVLVLAITGWPAGFIGSRIPEPAKTIIVIVVLLVLLLLGIVRF